MAMLLVLLLYFTILVDTLLYSTLLLDYQVVVVLHPRRPHAQVVKVERSRAHVHRVLRRGARLSTWGARMCGGLGGGKGCAHTI